MKNLKNKLVCIKWLDSYGVESGWQPVDDYTADRLVITSLGKVVLDNKDLVSIAGNFAEETANTAKQANGIMTIPKACIVAVYPVSLGSALSA